jgi:hypothetical protein
MEHVRRLRRRLVLAYRLRCARDDARLRHITTPTGVWACHHCPHTSLNKLAFTTHLSAVHA